VWLNNQVDGKFYHDYQ